MSTISLALRRALSALPILAFTASAQSAAGPVRQLGGGEISSPEVLGSLAAIRQLSNGNVLVNDQASRRVLLLDPSLKLLRIVADSTPNTNNAYGGRAGGLLGYRGDSALFVDPASLSLLVIDSGGKIIRTMAAPRPNEIQFMANAAFGTPGFDGKGRLVYRGGRPQPASGKPNADPVFPDSNALMRVELTTRKLDTVAFFKVQKMLVNISRDAQGNITNVDVLINNVLPVVDEWVVMTDGTVAIVRGQDYRVDFFDADNTVLRGPKLAYDWERLTDEQKVTVIDSTRAFREKARAAAVSNTTMAMTSERRVTSVVEGSSKSVSAGSPEGQRAAALPPLMLPDASELPDYRPAFGVGSVRADMDNRIWVRTTAVLQAGGGAIYDVIDKAGKRVDRVQVPVGVTIAGFGRGGVVYYAERDSSGTHLKKTKTK